VANRTYLVMKRCQNLLLIFGVFLGVQRQRPLIEPSCVVVVTGFKTLVRRYPAVVCFANLISSGSPLVDHCHRTFIQLAAVNLLDGSACLAVECSACLWR